MDYDKVWEAMNSLEGTICNACSVREVIETAITALEEREYKKAEALMNASYQFLKYFIDDFDTHFRVAWDETVNKCVKEDPWGHDDIEYPEKQSPEENEEDQTIYGNGYIIRPPSKTREDKVLKWQLPVQQDASGEYYFTLPDDLLEATGWKDGDELIWEENDGSFLLKK